MPDLAALAASNPYLAAAFNAQQPDWKSTLSNALIHVGAGIAGSSAAGQPWFGGIAPGIAQAANQQDKQQEFGLQRALQLMQMQQMESYRKAQEEHLGLQNKGLKQQQDLIEEFGRGGPGITVPQGAPQLGPAGGVNENNIGNVRPVGGGANSGFQQPPDFNSGVALTVNNARSYPGAFNGGQPMTLQQIGAKWAPKGDGANDPNQWAVNVSQYSGLPLNQPIDLSNPQVAAQFARGVHGAEKGAKYVKPVEAYLAGATGARPPVSSLPPYQGQGMPQVAQGGAAPPNAGGQGDSGPTSTYAPPQFPQLPGPPQDQSGMAKYTQVPALKNVMEFQQQQQQRQLDYQKWLYEQKKAQEQAARGAANQDIQLDANGNPTPNAAKFDYQRGISAAQGTDPSAKIDLELAQDAIKRSSEMQKGALGAESHLGKLGQLESLLSQVNTNKFAGTTLQIKSAAKAAGLDLDAMGIKDDVAPAQAVRAISNLMALENRNPSSGAGMPGAMSDADRNFLTQASVGITNDPEANRVMIEVKRGDLQRQVDSAKYARQYIQSQDFKRNPAGIDDFISAKLAEKNYYNPDLLKNRETVQPAPAGAVGVPPKAEDLYKRYNLKAPQ